MKVWALQDAKSKLSKLLNDSRKEPQMISRHGKNEAIVISIDSYRELTNSKFESALEFFQKSPLYGLDIECERDKSEFRKVDL